MWQETITTVCCDVNVAMIHNDSVVTNQQNLAGVPNPTFRTHGMTSTFKPQVMELEWFRRLNSFPKRDFFQLTKELV
jgi:hypothetical protein